MKINNKELSASGPTYFIADIAANHDGSLERAKRLIELSAKAGADAVKFQHFRAATIVSKKGFEEVGKLEHQKAWSSSVFDVYDKASLDWSWTERLAQTAKDCGVDFFTSPYDFESVDHVDEFVPAFKIGSGDITWLEIIEHIATKGKPVILATGASSIDDVKAAMAVLGKHAVPTSIMQCNTNYTGSDANLEHINLLVLNSYRQLFPESILGLSDHTHGPVTVLGAVALGARLIEKHFTDDNARPGPDHGFSMNSATWREMVDLTRVLESALGDGVKRIQENELKSSQIQRRGVRYLHPLPAGHVIQRKDLIPLRPVNSGGVPANQIGELVGRRLGKTVEADGAVNLDDFE